MGRRNVHSHIGTGGYHIHDYHSHIHERRGAVQVKQKKLRVRWRMRCRGVALGKHMPRWDANIPRHVMQQAACDVVL